MHRGIPAAVGQHLHVLGGLRDTFGLVRDTLKAHNKQTVRVTTGGTTGTIQGSSGSPVLQRACPVAQGRPAAGTIPERPTIHARDWFSNGDGEGRETLR